MGRVQKLYAKYGASFIVAYIAIFVLSMLGFIIAIQTGFQVEGATEGVGLFAAAWLGTKLLQPLRIGFSVALAPLVAKLIGKKIEEQLPDEPPDDEGLARVDDNP